MKALAVVSQFPRETPVALLDSDIGYFLVGVESGEILNIRFDFIVELIQFASQNYLMMTPGESNRVDGLKSESPHYITSGLLRHGVLNQSNIDGGLLFRGRTNHE